MPEVIATAGPHASGLMEHLPPPAPDQQQDDIKTTLLSPQFAQVRFHIMSFILIDVHVMKVLKICLYYSRL